MSIILWIIGLIFSILNCVFSAYSHNINAALGWGCASLWLIVLIGKEFEENNYNLK